MNRDDEKRRLRKELRRRLSELPKSAAAAESEACAETLFVLPQWSNAETILCFLSMEGEIGTRRIIDKAIAEKKRIGLPRMHGSEMEFHLVYDPRSTASGNDSEDIQALMGLLERHPYGVMEPPAHVPIFNPADHVPALVVTPGLAFDEEGRRLGRGKGYYDHWFARHAREIAEGSVSQAAIGFGLQLVEEVPVDEKDRSVPLLILGGKLLRAKGAERSETGSGSTGTD